MAAFINSLGHYYEGDRAHALDTEVLPRPSQWHVWTGQWVGPTPEQTAAREAKSEIEMLERREMLPRVTREVHLAAVLKDYMRDHGVDMTTALAQMTDRDHAGYNHGFVKLKAFDDYIAALRRKL